MPAPLMTWTQVATGVVPSTNVAGALSGLKDAVDAHVAANPTTALWEVADYSAGNGTLVLKPTAAGVAAGGAADARLMFFGGSSPNAAAIDSMTAGATQLYCGLAPSAGVDAPQQAYTTGAPFTTGPWLPGGIITNSYTSVDRVTYWETFDGIVVAWHKQTMSGTSNNLFTAILGRLYVDMDGETPRWCAVASNGFWSANGDSTISASGLWAVSVSTISGTTAKANALDASNNVIRTYRQFMASSSGGLAAARNDNRRFFYPVVMQHSESPVSAFKFRQIAYGVTGLFAETLATVDGVMARKVGTSSSAAHDGPWLCNFAVQG